jgi:signal peptidase I
MKITNLHLINKAKNALQKGDVTNAQHLLHQYIKQEPDDYLGWLMLGGLLKPEQGIKYLRKAYLLAPDQQEVIRALQWADEQLVGNHQIVEPRKNIPVVETTPRGRDTTPEKKRSGLMKWITNGILVVLLLILAVLFAIGFTAFLRGTEPTILDHQIIIVTSGSMEPVFYTGSIILIDTAESHRGFSEGDIVMFLSPDNPQTNVTHRIIEVIEDESGLVYRTKGDNNDYIDPTTITDQHIIGKYANITIPGLGYFFSFVKTRNGLILLAMTFGIFLIITQAIKIKDYLSTSDDE